MRLCKLCGQDIQFIPAHMPFHGEIQMSTCSMMCAMTLVHLDSNARRIQSSWRFHSARKELSLFTKWLKLQ